MVDGHSPSSSGAETPPSLSGSATLSSSIYSAFGGIMRRLSSDPAGHSSSPPTSHYSRSNGVDGVYHGPTYRTASPMRPPPLEPLVLSGFHEDTPASARLLTAAVAEEIRIMVPERLRIEDEWKLVYSLDQDGASLGTLYQKSNPFTGRRGGFVLVVRDSEGAVRPLLPPSYRPRCADLGGPPADVRRLPLRSAPPVAPLLRHGRVLPLACLRPGLPAPSALGRHGPPLRAHHDARARAAGPPPSRACFRVHWSFLDPAEPAVAPVVVPARLDAGLEHRGAAPAQPLDPLQGLPLQRRQ